MKSEWSTQITRKIVILQQNIDKIVISYFQVQNKNEPKEKEKEKKPETHRRSRLENISITLLNDRVISSDIGISSNLFQQQFHFIFFQFISSYIKKKKKKMCFDFTEDTSSKQKDVEDYNAPETEEYDKREASPISGKHV